MGRTWLYAYTAVWATTLASAAVVGLVGRPLAAPVRRLLGLTLSAQRTPPPQLGHVFVLAAHNIPIAVWPLLLGVLDAHRHRLRRHIADGLLWTCTVANTLPVGATLGAYGVVVLTYVPQLPVEWGALALGATVWLAQRRDQLQARQAVLLAVLIVFAMLAAATIETYAVPHVQADNSRTHRSQLFGSYGLDIYSIVRKSTDCKYTSGIAVIE